MELLLKRNEHEPVNGILKKEDVAISNLTGTCYYQ